MSEIDGGSNCGDVGSVDGEDLAADTPCLVASTPALVANRVGPLTLFFIFAVLGGISCKHF